MTLPLRQRITLSQAQAEGESAFATQSWPASAAIGQIPGLVVATTVAVFYLIAVGIAVRPRTWRAEDELHTQAIGGCR